MVNKTKVIFNLNKEEQALSDSLDRGEWKRVKNLKAEQTKARKAANNYLVKKQRINIRISETDLDLIKQKAAHQGMPYQTMIASILHRYASGHLENNN
jgi:predicted DNA binding CopG/RHH family protein